MCNCLELIKKDLIFKTGDDDLRLDLPSLMNLTTLKPVQKAGVLRFHYRKKKAKGGLEKRESSSFISFTYCPFCGGKYV